jgi:hypothetical protein
LVTMLDPHRFVERLRKRDSSQLALSCFFGWGNLADGDAVPGTWSPKSVLYQFPGMMFCLMIRPRAAGVRLGSGRVVMITPSAQHQEHSRARPSSRCPGILSLVAHLLSLASRNVGFPCGTSRGSGLELVNAFAMGARHGRR